MLPRLSLASGPRSSLVTRPPPSSDHHRIADNASYCARNQQCPHRTCSCSSTCGCVSVHSDRYLAAAPTSRWHWRGVLLVLAAAQRCRNYSIASIRESYSCRHTYTVDHRAWCEDMDTRGAPASAPAQRRSGAGWWERQESNLHAPQAHLIYSQAHFHSGTLPTPRRRGQLGPGWPPQ